MLINRNVDSGGFLVIDRSAMRILREPAGSWSTQEVLSHYRGFEGEPWPDRNDLPEEGHLAPLDDYHEILHYYYEMSQRYANHVIDLIYIVAPGSGAPQSLDLPGFSFSGYDNGSFISVWNHYSVIFNEVIYGTVEEMKGFIQLLNESLLLPSLSAVQRIADVRKRLLDSGADIEVAEDPEDLPRTICVFAYRGS